MTSLQLTAGTSKKFEHGAYLPPKVIPQPLFPASPAVPAIIRDMSKQENDTKFKPAHDSKIIQQGWDALKSANFTYIFSEEMLSFAKEVVKMTYNHIAQIENKELKFNNLPVGSILYLYQYHSCQYASRFPTYHVHENGIIIDEWKPAKFW